MADGNGVVYLAIVLSILGILVSYLHIKTQDDRLVKVARLVTLSVLLVVSGMMLYLYYLFMTSDMSNFYVWQYSKTDHPDKFKFSGVLAGLSGSLLFWIWWIIIPWSFEEWRVSKKEVDPELIGWTRIWTFVAMTMLLYTLTFYETFTPTPPDLLASTPEGNGLSPLLQTDLMVLHPPVVFIAYGVMVLPFAAGLAYLQTGRREWTRLSLDWSRVGWLFLTAGIGIGALWAYIVLGWGGYWAWDPIETSSLLPWLLLTGFLHAQLMFRRKGDYPLVAPLLAVFSYILVVFATFATRAAGLWVSVHAFPDESISHLTAWGRFTDIMANNPSVRVYMLFMVFFTIIAIILATRVYLHRERKEEDRYIQLEELIDDDMTMFATIALLVLTTVVTLLILVRGVEGLSAENFDGPIGVLAMVGVLVLLVCLIWRELGRKRVSQLALGTVMVSAAGYFLFPSSAVVAATMPILVVGALGTVYKVAKGFDHRRVLQSLRLNSAHMIHLSVVLIIIGYAGSSYLIEDRVLNLEIGGPEVEFGGYTFKATDIDDGTDHVFVDVEVRRGGRLLEEVNPGAVLIQGKVRSEVDVIGTLAEDVYLIYGNHTMGVTPRANITVSIMPLMSLLWAGMYLMMVAIVVRVVTDALIKRRRGRTVDMALQDDVGVEEGEMVGEEEEEEGDEEEPEENLTEEDLEEGEGEEPPTEARDDSYYEDLLEEELKRI